MKRLCIAFLALLLLVPTLSSAQEADEATYTVLASVLPLMETAEQAQSVTVTLEELGTETSWVRYGDKITQVPTSALSKSEGVPADKRVASIYAPKSGKATLRGSADKTGAELGELDAGTVVRVLEYGEGFSKIDCYGSVGYVMTNCLQFHVKDEEKQAVSAYLCFENDTSGKNLINVRNTSNRGSAKVGEWKTGTLVTILSYADGWYEVEAFGVCGYVMKEYIKVGE